MPKTRRRPIRRGSARRRRAKRRGLQHGGVFPLLALAVPALVAHQEYMGPWPEARYYDPDGIKPDTRKDFGTWYQTVQHREFNLHEKIVAYCQSDVQVLKAGYEIFQREFAAKADFNHMEKCVTIASACMWYYCKKTFAHPFPGLGTTLSSQVVGMGKGGYNP